MSATTWGNLTKNQEDGETIEEAILRIIQEHNANEEAHLGAGQSIQSHKASEIIDHLAFSIIEDKIGRGEVSFEKFSMNKHLMIPPLNSTAGWLKSGTTFHETNSFGLQTSTTNNTYAVAGCGTDLGTNTDWDKNFLIQFSALLWSTTNQIAYIGNGDVYYIAGEGQFVGFKIVNSTLYSCVNLDVDQAGTNDITHEIINIDITEANIFRIEYDSINSQISFYVNGLLKHVYTSTMPTGVTDSNAVFQIQTKEASSKKLVFGELLISRDR